MSTIALSPVEVQLVTLATRAKQERDAASQRAFEADLAPLIAAHDLTGLSVKVVDHEGGLALEVSP
ncbi:hypothetical protein [Humibacter sp.]|uniref:hypothetical protein n=1 Tax=Humibacter sp. TaxID=1940291 RepID=UPI003F7F684C